jgi:type I restriction enzyme, R subunit
MAGSLGSGLADSRGVGHSLNRRKIGQDPTFFEKFSKLIRDTIAEFHRGRNNDLVYLSTIRELREKVQNRRDDSDPTPARLRGDGHAQAFWGIARRFLEKAGVGDSELAAAVLPRRSHAK